VDYAHDADSRQHEISKEAKKSTATAWQAEIKRAFPA